MCKIVLNMVRSCRQINTLAPNYHHFSVWLPSVNNYSIRSNAVYLTIETDSWSPRNGPDQTVRSRYPVSLYRQLSRTPPTSRDFYQFKLHLTFPALLSLSRSLGFRYHSKYGSIHIFPLSQTWFGYSGWSLKVSQTKQSTSRARRLLVDEGGNRCNRAEGSCTQVELDGEMVLNGRPVERVLVGDCPPGESDASFWKTLNLCFCYLLPRYHLRGVQSPVVARYQKSALFDVRKSATFCLTILSVAAVRMVPFVISARDTWNLWPPFIHIVVCPGDTSSLFYSAVFFLNAHNSSNKMSWW